MLDKATFVRTNQPEELRQFLTPHRRAIVLKFRSAWYVEFTESHIELRSRIRDKDPDTIVNNIMFAVEAAKDWERPASEVRAA